MDIPLLSLLLNVAKTIGDIMTREAESKDALEALLAINNAAKETLKYEAWREENNGTRQREREQEISANWYGVSYRVLGYSEELARRLQFKGDYWQAPNEWTQLEIVDAGISLERVVEETDRLLKPRLKKR